MKDKIKSVYKDKCYIAECSNKRIKDSYFCSDSCQDKFYPDYKSKKEMTSEELRKRVLDLKAKRFPQKELF